MINEQIEQNYGTLIDLSMIIRGINDEVRRSVGVGVGRYIVRGLWSYVGGESWKWLWWISWIRSWRCSCLQECNQSQ